MILFADYRGCEGGGVSNWMSSNDRDLSIVSMNSAFQTIFVESMWRKRIFSENSLRILFNAMGNNFDLCGD